MKRKLLSFTLMLLFGFSASRAQLVFTVNETSGTMTNLLSPTTIMNGGNDDYGCCETALGFNFLFGGTSYRTFNANCDGFIVLGTGTVVANLVTVNSMLRQGAGVLGPPTIPSACSPAPAVGAANVAPICNCNNGSAGLPSMYVNNMTTTNYLPMIAPLWDDWVTNSATGKINYERFGVAPNRRITIEFLNLARWPNYNTAAYSMQVTLYETSNRIDMLYRFEGTTQAVAASIGLKTSCVGDQYFLSTAGIDNVTNPSRTTENRNNPFPGSGKLYRWIPPPAAVIPTNNLLCNAGAGGVAGGLCYATELAYDVSCNAFSTTIFGTTSSTVNVDAVFTNSCANTTQNDIWFYVDVPDVPLVGVTTMVVSTDNSPPATCGNTGGVQFEVYQSAQLPGSALVCPGNLGVPIVCSDNGGVLNANNSTTATLTITDNRRYFIRVDGDAALTPDFQICVKDKFNDEPCTAALLTPGTSCTPFAATTVGATASKCFAGGVGSVSTAPGQVQTVYTPATGDCQVYQSAAGATNVGNVITVTTTAGLVAGHNVRVAAGTGAFPAGTLVTATTATTFTTNFAPSIPLAGGAVIIGGSSNLQDVWFKFVAVAGTDYVIDTYAGTLTDGAMALYTGPVTPTCPLPTAIMTTGLTNASFLNFTASSSTIGDKVPSSVSAGSPDWMPRIVTSGLSSGTYYIRFWKGLNGATGGSFSICIYEKPSCGASAIGCPVPTAVVYNPNGNYNGTLCSTTDSEGLCFEKIPTIGTDFTPLCGDNFDSKAYYGNMPASTSNPASTTITMTGAGTTANLMVGSLMHTVIPGGATFPAGTTITGIVNATQFTVSNPPSMAYTGQQLTINAAPAGETPTNAQFCTSAALPNANMILRPIFYRIYPTVTGMVQMDFDNILTARNQGIRVALYTLSPVPTLPAHSCAGATWTLVPADFVSNIYGALPGITRYCNTTTALAAGITGNSNTAKFTMRWNTLNAGTTYFLMVDGNGPAAQPDRAFFSLTFSGTAVNADGVLAVKLLNFKGKSVEGSNVLSWFTASEQDHDYFSLERSKDGENFESIARIKGAGNSNSLLSYQSIDETPYSGINYYRLKSVDVNGMGKYSEIISLYSATGKKIEFEGVHPNPTSGTVFTDFYVTENTTLTVELRDISGQLVKSYNATVSAGKNSLESDTRDLDSGLYFISISDTQSGEKYTARFVRE